MEGLVLDSDLKSVLANFAVTKIHLERAEVDDPAGWSDFFHGLSNPPLRGEYSTGVIARPELSPVQ